jgi:hypothetical protein
MKKSNLILSIKIAVLMVLLSACQGGTNFLQPKPVEEVVPPSPMAEPWMGDWNVWVFEKLDEESDAAIINAKATTLDGEVFLNDGTQVTFSADLNMDGRAAVGTWEAETGETGVVSLILTEDKSQFLGALQGFAPICGVREGNVMPDPCDSNFEYDFQGGWYVWMGPLETEALFFYVDEFEAYGPLQYDINAFVSDDGQILAGTWKAVGSTGDITAKLTDNGIQFVGNMDGQFPFCGTRPGGSKPENCYWEP